MIISGRAFLHNTTFGSADSTFLFPWAIREYVFATGDIRVLIGTVYNFFGSGIHRLTSGSSIALVKVKKKS